MFLMRHGARHDAVYPAWKKTAERPYDTPLSHRGQAETPKLIFQRLSGKVRFGFLPVPFTTTRTITPGHPVGHLLSISSLPADRDTCLQSAGPDWSPHLQHAL